MPLLVIIAIIGKSKNARLTTILDCVCNSSTSAWHSWQVITRWGGEKGLVICDNMFPNLLSYSNIEAQRGTSDNTTNQSVIYLFKVYKTVSPIFLHYHEQYNYKKLSTFSISWALVIHSLLAQHAVQSMIYQIKYHSSELSQRKQVYTSPTEQANALLDFKVWYYFGFYLSSPLICRFLLLFLGA